MQMHRAHEERHHRTDYQEVEDTRPLRSIGRQTRDIDDRLFFSFSVVHRDWVLPLRYHS